MSDGVPELPLLGGFALAQPFSYWTCPQGHRWETTLPAHGPVACPICGAEGGGDARVGNAGDEAPTIGAPLPAPHFSGLEVHVEGYEILGELGRGGMGVVYKARHQGLNRVVALKMILSAEHAGVEQIARFRAEAEAVAQLIHPNIVQIYNVGEAEGRPYFSLEFVDGGTLGQKLNGQPQSARASAVLIEAIARAIHAAHERDIVHRDLKPGNILLAACHAMDSTAGSSIIRAEFPLGLPKITDFGLAKRLDSAGNTQTGAVIGTPNYMSPEQAAGRGKEVGPAADIYALGAILYEMITGRPPFRADSPMETLLQVMQEDPIPPSRLRPKLPRDLEVICLKCLRKQPKHRYASAQELADDLRRFLNSEPIAARPTTRIDRARHWVRRRPVLSAALGVALVGGLIIALEGATYHRKLRRALEQTKFAHQQADEQYRQSQHRLVRLAVANGERHLYDDDLLGALPWFVEALHLEESDPDRVPMHRVRLAAVLRQSPRLVKARFHEGAVFDVAVCSSGKLMVSGGDDGFGIVESLSGDRPTRQTNATGIIRRLAFRPDATWFLTMSEGDTVTVWNTATGQPVGEPLVHAANVTAASFSPDGTRVLTASRDRVARIWDPLTGRIVGPEMKSEAPLTDAAFHPDGKRIIVATESGVARIWDVARGEPVSVAMVHAKAIRHVAYSPDGRFVLTAGDDGVVKIWDASTGLDSVATMRHMREITSARFSPDGRRVVTASNDGAARVWNAADGLAITGNLKHSSLVNGAEFSPDGRWVVTAGDDNVARVWDATTGDPVSPPLRHNGAVYRATFSRDGRHVLTASQDGMARVWQVALTSKQGVSEIGDTESVVYSADGRLKVDLSDRDGIIQVYDNETDAPVGDSMAHAGRVRHATFSPDGKRLLTTGDDRVARIWDLATRLPIGEPMRHGSSVLYGSFSPDGKHVVTASGDNTARVWDAATGDPVSPPLKHSGSVRRAVFSPDGRAVLTASRDGSARAWDANTGEALSPLLAAEGWVLAALEPKSHAGAWSMPADRRSVEQLERLAMWLSGQKVDATGGMVPLNTSEMRTLWDEMQREQRGDLALTAAQEMAWHRAEAKRSEMEGDWFAAAFHLSEMIQHEPDDAVLRQRRGRAHAERQEWSSARVDFAAAIERGIDDQSIFMATALTHLAAGDREAYRRVCDELRRRFGPLAHGHAALQIAWLSVLACHRETTANNAELEACAVDQHPNALADAARGAAAMRAGNFRDALRLLTEGLSLTDAGETVRIWLYLAMAHHGLGHHDEASRWLVQAARWLDRSVEEKRPRLTWEQRLELSLLRSEASTLIQGTSGSDIKPGM